MDETNDQIESLPALQRLALAYAPRAAHTATLGLLSLDNRMAGIVRRASEPMMAQIRLAWWRELLAQDPTQWPKGEPLLGLLHRWEGRTADLAALVDGWETCVCSGDLDAAAVQQLADARGSAFAALAALLGHEESSAAAAQMGRNWAMADQAAHLAHSSDRDLARSQLSQLAQTHKRLPRDLRPLAVLNGLAARSARKGTGIDQLTPASLVPAIRIGLFGR